MFVVVEIAGLQYKVEQDQQLFVNRLKAAEGDTVTFDRVLLSDNGSVEVGAPVIDGLAVEAKVLKHLKGDKVIVFKKKRRKGYKVRNGYRSYLTQIEIVSIGGGKSSAKKAAPKKEEVKTDVVTPVAKAESNSKGDDLTKIEGVGPKVQGIFNEAGLHTFADVAAKSSEELKEILTPHGGRYASMTTDTWPKQAEMASAGQWDELKTWQDELNGGK